MKNIENENKLLILVSNDDGIDAKGVHELISRLVKFGDVVAVCPDGPRSGQSMAITVNQQMRLQRHEDFMGAEMWSVNGTPVDCVKLSMHTLFRNRRPDIMISGINHGSNASVNALYSGTMGAAFEACLQHIPAIGFSLTDHNADADFKPCFPFVDTLVEKVIHHGLPDGVCLNVNIPNSELPPTQMQQTRSCKGNWSDEYQQHFDSEGKEYFTLAGAFVNEEPDNHSTDEYLLKHGIVSVVAQTTNRTDSDVTFNWI